VRLNAFAQQPEESAGAHRQRIAEELRAQRETMAAKDAQPIAERSPHDYHGRTDPEWLRDWPDEPRVAPTPGRRERVLARISEAQAAQPVPTVAISHRGGFGYDSGVFSKGSTRANVLSAPPGFDALPRGTPDRVVAAQETRVADARDPAAAPDHLAGASGLFIPGGQDIPTHGSREQQTRETYEQALIHHARNRGIPTLGVCGGSRCLARGFGGREAQLSGRALDLHNQKGTVAMPHGLRLAPHTLLGGASPTPRGTVDRINSTHQKVVDFRNVNQLPATREPEIRISADDQHGLPEGFETTHGAPIIGVTSHPEAIHGANRAARDAASPQGRRFSDNVFRGFEQSQRAYAARQQVNAQILAGQGRPLRGPGVQLAPHLEDQLDDNDPDYHRVPPLFFGSARPATRRGGSVR
jgi:gamma-glutamyl-gamma-aminobutyrate hydrolase PuuD